MKKAITLLVGILALLFMYQCSSSKSSIVDNPLTKGEWKTIKSVDGSEPTARHEAAFIGLGNQIFLIGGRGMKPTNIYDIKKNKWTAGAVPPIEMHHLQPITYKGKIYIMGALTGKYPGETPIPNIYIYHPDQDRWEKSTAIPANRQRGAAGVVVYKDKFYMACGIKDGHRGDHKQWLDVFDPASAKWEVLPDAPRPRDHFQAVVANDQLYLLGGRTTVAANNPFRNTISEIDVYDFQSGKWRTLEKGLPTQRAGNYASLVGNEIIVMGGESFFQKESHAETEALHIGSHEWRSLAPMIQGRHGTGGVLHKGKVYVASGSGNRGGGPELTSMEAFSF